MSGSANVEAAIISRLKEKVDRSDQLEKIKRAFPCLTDAAVLMMWHGLQAQGIKDIEPSPGLHHGC
jgi:hypothetical protein